MKYGYLNFLEPSGPLQACNGSALPLPCVVFKGLICFCEKQSLRARLVALTGMSVGICTWCHDSVKPNLSWEMRQFRWYAERTRQGRNRRNKERDRETRQKRHGNSSCNREAVDTLCFLSQQLYRLVSVDKKALDFKAKEMQGPHVQRYVARNSSAEIRRHCSSSTVITGYTERFHKLQDT
jgi:hypothetical protein